eukprot:TRINITY_DN21472_c0_g1_i1.p2 TRINITY_DN21472_c0_g1~~TRINITY_DN21472_c0_g1_i1.p2  ORF type:complete len:206 (+),score=60.74 TRINITY_DN21472_c0_g1_i1:27-644(+)
MAMAAAKIRAVLADGGIQAMSLEEMEQSDDFIRSFNIHNASTRAFLEAFDANRSTGHYSSDDCLSWELQRLAAIAEKMEAQQSAWEKECVEIQERRETRFAKDKKLIQAEEAMLCKMEDELTALEQALEKASLARHAAAVSATRPPPPPIPAGFAGAGQEKAMAALPAGQPQEPGLQNPEIALRDSGSYILSRGSCFPEQQTSAG